MKTLFDMISHIVDNASELTDQTNTLLQTIYREFHKEHGLTEAKPKFFSMAKYKRGSQRQEQILTAANQLFLFGGDNAGAAASRLDDTWLLSGTTWTQASFSAAGWSAGQTGVGYSTSVPFGLLQMLDVVPAMLGTNTSAYVRVPFSATDVAGNVSEPTEQTIVSLSGADFNGDWFNGVGGAPDVTMTTTGVLADIVEIDLIDAFGNRTTYDPALGIEDAPRGGGALLPGLVQLP